MALSIAIVGDITATTAKIFLAGGGVDPVPGGATRWEIQISIDREFRFAVSPRWSLPGNGDGTDVVSGLNAGTTYFLRARNRYSTSVEEWGPVVGFTTLAGTARILTPATIMTEPAAIVVPEPLFNVAIDRPNVAGFPPSNLLIDAPVAARAVTDLPSGDPGTVAITFQTAGLPIDTIALLMTNMPEDASIEIWEAATRENLRPDKWTSFKGPYPFRASSRLPGRPGYHALVRLPAPLIGPWFNVVVRRSPTPGRIVHFEHLIVGRNRVTKNHSVEVSVAPQPLTTSERRRSGIIDRVPGMPLRRVEFELAVLTEAQFEANYQDLWRRENYPILVVPNTKPGSFLHDRIFYGDLTGGRVSQTGIRYTRGFSVVSMI